jgi:hypothetical protein
VTLLELCGRHLVEGAVFANVSGKLLSALSISAINVIDHTKIIEILEM